MRMNKELHPRNVDRLYISRMGGRKRIDKIQGVCVCVCGVCARVCVCMCV